MIINEKSLSAIKQLYPSVTNTSGEDCFTTSGTLVEINESNVNAKITEMETAETNKATAKATAQASGNTKLLDLGLTQAEATALTGYTPPAEV